MTKKVADPPDTEPIPVLSKADKLKALRKISDKMNKDYAKKGGVPNARAGNKQVVMFQASEMTQRNIKIGVPTYDVIAGGDPVGRIVVDYGVTGSGKSTWNYMKIAILQEMGKICAVVNVEGGFDPVWAEKCGVNLSELIVIDQGSTFEETVQFMYDLMKENLIDHWLVDSIHGQLTKKEMYKSDGKGGAGAERKIIEDSVGALPLKLGAFLKRVTSLFGKTDCTMTVIGQARTDIDTYGAPVSLTGGHALKHFARRICRWTMAAKSEWPRQGDTLIGHTAKVFIELQQLNEHQGEFYFVPFRKGEGVWKTKFFVDEAKSLGIVRPGKGSYWTWEDHEGKTVNINGMPAVYKYFEENPEELEFIRNKMLAEAV